MITLRSRRVLASGSSGGLAPASLVVDNGRIVSFGAYDVPGIAEDADFGDLVLMPGLVDSHVHVNEPGRTDWEGFRTATQAAAAGGVTTLVDMPLNCLPVTTTKHALEVKLAELPGKLHVDVGFWGGVIPGNVGELAPMAKAGVLGCKAFMVNSGIDEFPNATEDDLRAAMPVLRDAGVVLLAHAEVDLGDHDPPHGDDGRTYASYLRSRPREWENEAIRRLIALSTETRCPVHVVHLSSSDALPMLADARARGVKITSETCPHYLCFDAEHVPAGNTLYKCAPPIREHDNRERLWQGLRDGVIDLVVSDHSPCTAALKTLERGDFHEAWGGVSSLSLGLSAVWTEAQKRGFALADVALWMSERPAFLAGLAHKGRLAPGCDADFVAWDPEATFVVDAQKLHFKNKQTPYDGRTLSGVVHATYLRGEPVFRKDASDPFAAPRGRTLLGRERRA